EPRDRDGVEQRRACRVGEAERGRTAVALRRNRDGAFRHDRRGYHTRRTDDSWLDPPATGVRTCTAARLAEWRGFGGPARAAARVRRVVPPLVMLACGWAHGLCFPPARVHALAWVVLVPALVVLRRATSAVRAALLAALLAFAGTIATVGWLPHT